MAQKTINLYIPDEIWKDIPGYEGSYQVSNLGRVKSLDREICVGNNFRKIKGNVKSLYKNKHGYLEVNLFKNNNRKNIEIHRLVAMAFLNHKPNGNKIVVDHIDNDKLNNTVDNIQIITQRKNTSKDKWRKKTSSKYVGVMLPKGSRKWSAQIRINGKIKRLGYYDNELDALGAYKKELKKYENT